MDKERPLLDAEIVFTALLDAEIGFAELTVLQPGLVPPPFNSFERCPFTINFYLWRTSYRSLKNPRSIQITPCRRVLRCNSIVLRSLTISVPSSSFLRAFNEWYADHRTIMKQKQQANVWLSRGNTRPLTQSRKHLKIVSGSLPSVKSQRLRTQLHWSGLLVFDSRKFRCLFKLLK